MDICELNTWKIQLGGNPWPELGWLGTGDRVEELKHLNKNARKSTRKCIPCKLVKSATRTAHFSPSLSHQLSASIYYKLAARLSVGMGQQQ